MGRSCPKCGRPFESNDCPKCGRPFGKRRRCYYCDGRPKIGTPESRFWEKVDRRGSDDCWEWRGTRNAKGYGQFRPYGRKPESGPEIWKAARFSYLLAHGEIPEDQQVCHRCDNPPCVNPAHLYVGTLQENINDREAKGRNVTRAGEDNGNAKLTQEQADEIRRRVVDGESQLAQARRFGVSTSTINNVVHGRCY